VINKFCLGLTGRMASGKGEIVKVLERKGFKYISLSDIVRERAAKEGGIQTRSRMQDIGNQLRSEGGAGVLGKKVRERIESLSEQKWVIDGIRNPEEIKELRKINRFFLIAVLSERKIIIDRLINRSRNTDAANIDELNRRLDREWGIGEPDGGQQVGRCIEEADFKLNNNGTVDELEKEIIKLLLLIEGENG